MVSEFFDNPFCPVQQQRNGTGLEKHCSVLFVGLITTQYICCCAFQFRSLLLMLPLV